MVVMGFYCWVTFSCVAQKTNPTHRALFKAHVDKQLLQEIRNSGLALGGEQFTQQIEALTEQLVPPRKAGRPKKMEMMALNI
jgi:hypothetical protein